MRVDSVLARLLVPGLVFVWRRHHNPGWAADSSHHFALYLPGLGLAYDFVHSLLPPQVRGALVLAVVLAYATEIPQDVPGVFYVNPEYGERLGDIKELEATYARIGDFMKQKCGGYYGYVFTGNLELAKKIGLKAKRRIEFYTSTIDCRLLEYELYSGSRNVPKEIKENI